MTIDEIFTTFPRLETSRLLLRQIEPRDAEALFATFSDEAVMEYYGDLPHRTLDESRGLIASQQGWYARRDGIRWGITRKGADEVIGSCGFFNFDEGFHRAEMGYELRRAYWRQGIMREALTAIMTFGFGEMGLQRIEATIDDNNAGSKGILLALGFKHEGTLRNRFFFKDRLWDEEFYGMLRDEWLAKEGQ